jgi:dipeptidyl-peptidase-4
MADAVNGMTTTLAPKGLKEVQWRPGTDYLYAEQDGKKVSYVAHTGAAISEHINGATWLGKDFYYSRKGDTLIFEDLTRDAKAPLNYILPKNSAHLHFSPDGQSFAYTVDNQLYGYFWNYQSNKPRITNDANPNIINGQAVHRNEFGIDNGIFFSPKGNYLAYYRMDQTMVADYPVIDWSQVPAKNENVKYPMAGGISHQVTIRIYNPATEKTIELQTGKDRYLTSVTWSPDEQYIYVGILNRAQNHLRLNQYNARTGEKVKTILEEKDDKYVEPQHPLAFLPGSTDQFIWWSQRDGYMHLWLCNLKTNSMKCLTPGAYVVNDLLGFNIKRNEVLLASAKEDPREKHGYAVNWSTGKMRRLDTEPGIHNYTASDDGEYLYEVLTSGGYPTSGASLTNTAIPKRSQIRAADGRVIKVLTDSPNPLSSYDRPEIKDIKLKADDGTPLYGKLILPTSFNPQKKYPVIVYLYNGPHVQLIKNGFPESGNLWYEYLAQHGYIVWTMDGRGSSNRGLKFEQTVFRRLGTVEMQDQLQGVEFLKSLPYVDSKRMGIHGWSFGGFMTTSFMLRNPGVFKVGIAGGPVMDWRMYEIMYGERYMDTPEENPKGYEDANLLTKVKNLQGKLLLIHGAQDATVVWQHSINFLKKSVDENVQVDYFVYPGYEHNVRGKDRVHLMQKVTDYFNQNL